MAKIISNQAIKETSTTRKMALGTLVETPDGRKFRYARNNASTASVAANLQVSADAEANHVNRLIDSVVVPAVGDKKVQLLTIGATALTLNQYQDGYMVMRDGTGEGYIYQIEGHKAYDASAADVIVDLRDAVEVAPATTSEVSLNYNPYDLLVISATDQLDFAAGIAHRPLAASEYGFIQTGGPAPVWADEAFAKGVTLTTGTGVAGQVEMYDAAGEPLIGVAIYDGVDAEETLAYLTID